MRSPIARPPAKSRRLGRVPRITDGVGGRDLSALGLPPSTAVLCGRPGTALLLGGGNQELGPSSKICGQALVRSYLRLGADMVLKDEPAHREKDQSSADRDQPPLVESQREAEYGRRQSHPKWPVAAGREEA